MMTLSRRMIVSLASFPLVLSLAGTASGDAVGTAIQSRLSDLASRRIADIAGEGIVSLPVLQQVYTVSTRFAPVWDTPVLADPLVRALESSAEHGLTPGDYHLEAIRTLRARPASSPQAAADLDLLMSDAMLRLAYHLHFGKVDPERLDPDWNMARVVEGFDPAAWFQRAIASGDAAGALAALAPARPYYWELRRVLSEYRAIAASGGWPAVPAGPALRPGMNDPRVPMIRRRLAVTGDWIGSFPSDSALYDDSLAAAVRRFQYRAHETEDGVAGASTIQAMSVPAARRVDQVRIDLERARWAMHDLADTLVVVNISSSNVYLMEQEQVTWRARCMVGQPSRKTPVFADRMRYLEFNPTWTVPRGILAKDILPAGKRGEAILERKHLKAIDGAGRVVAPSSIDWSRYTASTFPYALRQDPGPQNALGRVKFMFPNHHSVYLHDTPSRDLFAHSRRTFSSGCVRVENPLQLAERLLADSVRWNAAAIQRVVDSGRTTRVDLARPLPVLLLYWTVSVDDQGKVRFSDDVYRRDAPVLKALDEPFRPRARPLGKPAPPAR